VLHGVLVIAYPPHTSQVIQVLDVRFFGFLKRSKKFQVRDDGLDAHMGQLLKPFRAYGAVTVKTTIRAARRKAGLKYRAVNK
jgi:hypothetical protein